MFFILAGVVMGVLGLALVGISFYARLTSASEATNPGDCLVGESCQETVQYTIRRLPALTTTAGLGGSAAPAVTPVSTATALPLLLADAATPTPPLATATSAPAATSLLAAGIFTKTELPDVNAGLVITGSQAIAEAEPEPAGATTNSSIQPAALAPPPSGEVASEQRTQYVEPYTVTNEIAPPPSARNEPAPELASEPGPACATTSGAHFDLIPIEGSPHKDHPDAVHGDLNLALRGFIPASEALDRVTYSGATDGDAPRLHGLFEPNRQAEISSVYRVNDWIWDPGQCGGHPRGCPGPPAEDYWPVTMVGLKTNPGEAVHVPERGAQIYAGGFVAMVLYAEEQRLTLGYTRRDTVSAGYVVHLENLCVDPNLVALYRAQMDAAGWHATGHLPALRNNQTVGTALGAEMRVAIRDVGTFMDPRSYKDWWR